VQQTGQEAGGFRFPADQLGPTAFADHHGSAVGQVQVLDVEGEDLAGAGGGLVQQPPQGLVPQRVGGGQEGQQLSLGYGPGAGVIGPAGP